MYAGNDALVLMCLRTKLRRRSLLVLAETNPADKNFDSIATHLQSGVINILDACVEEVAILLFPSDSECLFSGSVTEAVTHFRLESRNINGLAATKCDYDEMRILSGALWSFFPCPPWLA